jgi:hypothetical protein
MRLGGFGPLFLFLALPGAVAFLLRRARDRTPHRWEILLLWLAAVAQPEPSTARFILAFPAVALSIGAAAVSERSRSQRGAMQAVAVLLASWGLLSAVPGLTGEGPSLLAFLRLPAEDRDRALGPDGPPGPFLALRDRMRPGEIVAYDASFTLAGLLFRSDLTNRVLALPWDLTAEQLERGLTAWNVRYLVAGHDETAGRLARSRPDRFHQLFACRSDPCAVYHVE